MSKAAALSVVVAGVQLVVVRGLVLALGATPADEKWVYVGTAIAFVAAAIPASSPVRKVRRKSYGGGM